MLSKIWNNILGRRATPFSNAWTLVNVEVKTTTPAAVAHSLVENILTKAGCEEG